MRQDPIQIVRIPRRDPLSGKLMCPRLIDQRNAPLMIRILALFTEAPIYAKEPSIPATPANYLRRLIHFP